MGVTVKLEKRGLDRLVTELPAEVDAVVRAAAFAIEREAKIKAPVDTGNLRNSIKVVDAIPMDAKAEVVVGASYGIFVERGTRYARAQAFLEPAVRKVRPMFEASLAALMARLTQG